MIDQLLALTTKSVKRQHDELTAEIHRLVVMMASKAPSNVKSGGQSQSPALAPTRTNPPFNDLD